MLKAILFDLDGTLVDTLPDVAATMNAVLTERGFPPRATGEIRNFMGWGSRELSRLSLPEEARTDETIDTVNEDMKKRYAAYPVVYAKPYPGWPEALAQLAQGGIRLAVLSNKPDLLTRMVVQRLFPEKLFSIVQGALEELPHKPDPAVALSMARELSVEPGECLFVGDSDVDMRTAVNAGMVPAGVAWGYRSVEELRAAGAVHILDRPSDLIALKR